MGATLHRFRTDLVTNYVGELAVAKKKHNAGDIEVLTLPEAIRKRPGMYIGWTDHRGVQHLVWELVANSVDQVLAGRAIRVEIIIHNDDSIEVVDDGPGINLLSQQVRSYFLEGHNEPTADSHSPHIHISNFGVGLVVANALSLRFEVTTRFQGQTLRAEWTDGAGSGGTPEVLHEDRIGTSIRMWPDTSILQDVAIRPGALDQRVHELNALIPNLHLTVSQPHALTTWQSGMASLLDRLHGNAGGFRDPLMMSLADETGPGSPINLRICFAPTGDSRDERITSFCNFRSASDEGAFIRAMRSTIWQVGRGFIGRPVPPEPDTTPIQGLALVASITMLSPEWGGPTRSKLDDPRSVAMAENLIVAELPRLLENSEPLREMLRLAY